MPPSVAISRTAPHHRIPLSLHLAMASSFQDITDPSDFNISAVPRLRDVDSCLRCPICKNFFEAPMSTLCGHTFCSLCLRNARDRNPKCPMCVATVDLSKVQKNLVVSEVIEAWKASRELLLRQLRTAQQTPLQEPVIIKKRRSEDVDDIYVEPPRKSRRQTRRSAPVNYYAVAEDGIVEIASDQDEDEDEAEDEDDQILSPAEHGTSGGVICPACGKKVQDEVELNKHLDANCGNVAPSAEPSFVLQIPPPRTLMAQPEPPKRQSHLNFSLLPDPKLRHKLRDIGIPLHGTRQQMEARHKQWVNICNANCDSHKPRSKQELLRDLDAWERVQSHRTSTTVPLKGLDGDQYRAQHRPQYNHLIQQARESRVRTTKATETANGNLEDQGTPPSPAQVPVTHPERPPTSWDDAPRDKWSSPEAPAGKSQKQLSLRESPEKSNPKPKDDEARK
jgi:E3 ubiquitin-protein ligase RAD18